VGASFRRGTREVRAPHLDCVSNVVGAERLRAAVLVEEARSRARQPPSSP
jgi:hypothetical protein